MALLIIGCDGREVTESALPSPVQETFVSSAPAATPQASTVNPTFDCPPARGEGTISPTVTIYSITLLVDGQEYIVQADDVLPLKPGAVVQVTEVTICANTFSGSGGAACVEFTPLDQSGQEILAEQQGTHTVPVNPGLFVFSNIHYSWIIDPDWNGFSAVVNHWTLEKSQDLACANGRCEQDDRVFIEFR